MSTEKKILFYVKDNKDLSIWAIHEISTTEPNRLGWLNGTCVDIGNDSNNFLGADIGLDAETALASERYDISKSLSTFNHPQ